MSDLTAVVADASDASGSNARRVSQALGGSDKTIYVAIELSMKLASELGGVEMDRTMFYAMMAPSLGMTADDIAKMYDSGKTAIEDTPRGEDKLEPAMLRQLVDGVKMQMELMPGDGPEITEDMLFQALAEILEITPAQVREKYESAAP
jgi:hypothetical protein